MANQKKKSPYFFFVFFKNTAPHIPFLIKVILILKQDGQKVRMDYFWILKSPLRIFNILLCFC